MSSENYYVTALLVYVRSYVAGISLTIDGVATNVRVIINKIACDTPAKAEAMNMIKFNGLFGCSICEIPGERVPQGQGSTHSYASELVFCRRTMERLARQAEKGTQAAPVWTPFSVFE